MLGIFFILAILLTGCTPKNYDSLPDPEPLQPFYVPEEIRVALVLGSGGVRGMAHVGVLEELEAAHIPIDLIVGCSAGSIVGALYAENPCVEKIKEAVWNLRSDSIFDFNLLTCRYGLSQGRSLYQVIDTFLGAETFEELKIPLVIVATDLNSGELVPMGTGDLVKSIRASCSIPFVFVPCNYMGRVLVDGGVINPVPVRVAKDLGADLVIAVDLCELLEKTYPTNLFQVADRSAEIIFMWQNEVCTRNADLIIRPKTCGVGTFNDKMKCLVYEAGKLAAREKLPEIQALLQQKGIYGPSVSGKRLVQLKCYQPSIEQGLDHPAEKLSIPSPIDHVERKPYSLPD